MIIYKIVTLSKLKIMDLLINFFKPHKNLNKISTLALSGVCLLKGSILSNIKKKKLKFKSILKKNKKYVSAYETREFIKDIGTPKRVEWARKFLLRRDISKKL